MKNKLNDNKNNTHQHITLHIGGMHCASCVAVIRNALEKQPGISQASINIATHTAKITYDIQRMNTQTIQKIIEQAGYTVIQNNSKQKTEEKFLWYVCLGSAILTIPLVIFTMFIPLLSGWWQLALTTPVQFIGGYIFYKGAYKALRNKRADMNTLVALGTSAAYFYSIYKLLDGHMHFYFEAAAVIITLISVGRLLEYRAKKKASQAIKELLALQVKDAIVIEHKKHITKQVTELKIGDKILIKPGASIPIDAVIIEGQSEIDESMVTGESIPVLKKINDSIIGGTLNTTGSLIAQVHTTQEATVLSKIITLVQDAQNRQAPIQRLVDTISGIFVPIVLVIAILTNIVWFMVTGNIQDGLLASVAVLVIACPCALGLATPTALMVGSGISAKKGILVKGGDIFEKANHITHMAFDKTGTITEGKPNVIACIPTTNYNEEYVLHKAASVEAHSEHPLAQAIVQHYEHMYQQPLSKVQHFSSQTGIGVTGTIHKTTYKITKPDEQTDAIVSLQQQGATVVAVYEKNTCIGYIGIADTIKPSAIQVIQYIKQQGIQPILITGDHQRVADTIAQQVGISTVYAQVQPEDKSRIVQELQQQSKKNVVSFVGDGINDAPALAQADIGIAMGSGTQVAIESGDIVLLQGNISLLKHMSIIIKKTMSTVKQNLFWAFLYNVLLIPVAAGVLYPIWGIMLNPMLAGAAMALSSVSVVLNSLLLHWRTK